MKAFLVLLTVSLGVLASGTAAIAADQTTKPAMTSGQTNPAVRTAPMHSIYTPPRAHANYECANGNCTCSNQRDCSAMVSDGVCKDGTYNNGSCLAKAQ